MIQLGLTYCIGCDEEQPFLAEFLEHRHDGVFEPIFVKDHRNAFSNPHLAKYLNELEIQEVVLVGCQTNTCILKTAQGAVRNRFDVRLLEGCTYPQFAGEEEKKMWMEDVKSLNPHRLVRIE